MMNNFLRFYDISYEVAKVLENFKYWFVAKLPKWILKYSFVHVTNIAFTNHKYKSVEFGTFTCQEALARFMNKESI